MKYILLLIFISCSTMNKDECSTADWQSLGENDSSTGQNVDVFLKRQNTCSKFGIKADLASYTIGYSKGLVSYCSSSNGAIAGESGEASNLICDKKQFADYAKSYQQGLRSFCSIDNAKKMAKALKSYPAICSPDTFIHFYSTYTNTKASIEREIQITKARHDHFVVHEKILLNSRKLACSFDDDCRQHYSCSFDKCTHTGLKCTFDSDCSFVGICGASNICRF